MSTSEHEGSDDRSVAQNLFLRYVKEVRNGGNEAFELLCEKHPEQASYLRELHSVYRLGAALTSSQSFHESIRERFGDIEEITLSVEEDSSVDVTLAREMDDGSLPRTCDTSRYSLEGEIARGGMGVVFRVKDQDLSRSIAMKVMSPREEGDVPEQSGSFALARFLEEAQVMAQLDHPGIVPVYEVGFDADGQLYFTMKLVKGRTFNDICSFVKHRADGWNTSRALAVLVRVCQAVAFAQSKGVIHRDLKPSNIMVGRFGEAYVMDWGLAKVKGRKDLHDIRVQHDHDATYTSIQSVRKTTDTDHELALVTLDGSVLGTPAYMPPEQAAGRVDDVDERSDIYSLGAVLYKLLTGTAPYLREDAKLSPHTILGLVVQGPPADVETLNPKVSAELAAICRKAMQREQTDRYQSCQDLAEDIQAYLDRRVVRAYRSGAAAELMAWVKRNRSTATVAATAACVVLLGVLGFVLHLGHSRQQLDATATELRRRLYSHQIFKSDFALTSGHISWARALLNECPKEYRGWEWNHLRMRAEVRGQEFLTGHEDGIRSVVVGSQGDWLISASEDKTLRFWDTKTRQDLRTIVAHRDVVTSLTYDSRKDRIASGSTDGTVKLWSVPSGEHLLTLNHGDEVERVSFGPQGDRVASGAADGLVKVWDTATGELLGVLRGHEGAITALRFAPDGERIVSGGADKTVRVWNASVYDERPVILHRHENPIGALDISSDPSQTRIASGSGSFTAGGRVMMTVDNEDPQELRLEGAIMSLAFSPAGDRLAMGQRFHWGVKIWDTDGLTELDSLTGHEGHISALAFFPDGMKLVSGGSDNKVAIWSLKRWEPHALRSSAAPLRTIDFSPDGDRLVSASLDGTLNIWDVRAGEIIQQLDGDSSGVAAVAFSPDGRFIAAGGLDGQVAVWNAVTGKLHQQLSEGFETSVFWIDISPDGTQIAATNNGGFLHLWDTKTGAIIQKVSLLDGGIDGLAFSPDGKRVAVLSILGTLKLWDIADRRVVWEVKMPRQRVRCVAFNDAGTRLVAGGNGSIWGFDAITGKTVMTLRGHTGLVSSVFFTANDSRIVSSSLDGSIKIWMSTGEELLTLPSSNMCWHAAMSPDGKTVASSYEDGSIRFWETSQPIE